MTDQLYGPGHRARTVFPGGPPGFGWIDLVADLPGGGDEPDDDGTPGPDDDDRDGDCGHGSVDPERGDHVGHQPVPVPDSSPDGPIPGGGDWDPDKVPDPADPRREAVPA